MLLRVALVEGSAGLCRRIQPYSTLLREEKQRVQEKKHGLRRDGAGPRYRRDRGSGGRRGGVLSSGGLCRRGLVRPDGGQHVLLRRKEETTRWEASMPICECIWRAKPAASGVSVVRWRRTSARFGSLCTSTTVANTCIWLMLPILDAYPAAFSHSLSRGRAKRIERG